MKKGRQLLYFFAGILLLIGFIWSVSERYNNAAAKVLAGAQLQIKQISVGMTHTCAVASDNWAYCWGKGSSGQLGNGTTTATQTTPVAISRGVIPAGATIRQVIAGESRSCAIASDNKAYCWGSGSNGQLGNGSVTSYTTPVAVSQGAMPAGATVQQVTLGKNHACLIASDNKAYCWGVGSNGILGNGATSAQYTPAPYRRALCLLTRWFF